jgi:hypothetical protein
VAQALLDRRARRDLQRHPQERPVLPVRQPRPLLRPEQHPLQERQRPAEDSAVDSPEPAPPARQRRVRCCRRRGAGAAAVVGRIQTLPAAGVRPPGRKLSIGSTWDGGGSIRSPILRCFRGSFVSRGDGGIGSP